MDEETLIDKVREEMLSDDENLEKQSDILIRTYKESSPETKNKIDEIFICLCGWSLQTLLNRQEMF